MSYESYFDFLTKKEEENIERTRQYLSRELEVSKEALEMLYDILKAVAKSFSKKWTHSKKAILFLLPRLLMSTKTSIELLTRGYYYDHAVVQRSLLESLALLMLFSEDEESAKKWLKLEELELPKWKLMHHIFPSRAKKMLKLVDKMYAELSDYAHSSLIAIIHEWSLHLAHKKTVLDFPKFDKSLIREHLSSPPSLLAIGVLTGVFEEELEESFREGAINFLKREMSKWIAEGLLEEHKRLLDD